MAKKVVKKIAVENEEINFSLIAYILGIVAIVEAFISPIAGVVFAIIGIVLIKKKKDSISKKAFKLNLIGLILGIVFLIFVIIASFVMNGNYIPQI
jgi:uncharacterized membrane protein